MGGWVLPSVTAAVGTTLGVIGMKCLAPSKDESAKKIEENDPAVRGSTRDPDKKDDSYTEYFYLLGFILALSLLLNFSHFLHRTENQNGFPDNFGGANGGQEINGRAFGDLRRSQLVGGRIGGQQFGGQDLGGYSSPKISPPPHSPPPGIGMDHLGARISRHRNRRVSVASKLDSKSSSESPRSSATWYPAPDTETPSVQSVCPGNPQKSAPWNFVKRYNKFKKMKGLS